jgi:hypothetical protein
VAALDSVESKYAQRRKSVEITGLNDPSADLHTRLTGELTGGHGALTRCSFTNGLTPESSIPMSQDKAAS